MNIFYLIGVCVGLVLCAIWVSVDMFIGNKELKAEVEARQIKRKDEINAMIKLYAVSNSNDYFIGKSFDDLKKLDMPFLNDEKTQSSIISTGERVTYRTWEWTDIYVQPVFTIELKFNTEDICVEVLKNTLKDLTIEQLNTYKSKI